LQRVVNHRIERYSFLPGHHTPVKNRLAGGAARSYLCCILLRNRAAFGHRAVKQPTALTVFCPEWTKVSKNGKNGGGYFVNRLNTISMKKQSFSQSPKIAGLLFAGLLLLCSTTLHAQDEKKFSMDVTLNSDIFFGFYPFFAGGYQLSDKLDLTFYGILWSGGTGAAWGNWTEFGIGIGLPAGPSLYVNPQIGLLNGSLTSGLGTPVLGEGIVPNITIGYEQGKAEGELYAGYYLGFNHGNPNTNTYLHYWLNGGYQLFPFLSAGLHLEHLRFTGGENLPDDASYDYYFALGPYVQFAAPQGGPFARFTAGTDLRSDEQISKSGWQQPSFFKLTVGMSF
jgi:hypothetical protein